MYNLLGIISILIIILILYTVIDWQIPVSLIILIMAAASNKTSVVGGVEVEYFNDLEDDDFPYKYKFVETPIPELLENIKHYNDFIEVKENNIRKKPALYDKVDIVTDLFNEKPRMLASVTKFPSPYEYWQKHKTHIKKVCHTTEDMREYLYKNTREATTFSPGISAYIYDTLLEEPGLVYDPFGGWGDRMIGTYGSDKVISYKCSDLNPDLSDGYDKIITYIPKASYVIDDALHAATNEPNNKYDLIFTSPPYFTFEKYNAKNKLPDNYHKWLYDFVEPLIIELYRILKDGRILAIHVSNVSVAKTLLDDFITICSKYGTYIKTINIVSKISVPIIVFKKK